MNTTHLINKLITSKLRFRRLLQIASLDEPATLRFYQQQHDRYEKALHRVEKWADIRSERHAQIHAQLAGTANLIAPHKLHNDYKEEI